MEEDFYSRGYRIGQARAAREAGQPVVSLTAGPIKTLMKDGQTYAALNDLVLNFYKSKDKTTSEEGKLVIGMVIRYLESIGSPIDEKEYKQGIEDGKADAARRNL